MRADFGVKETLANDSGAGQREAGGDDREIRAGTEQYRSYDVHEICCCMEIAVRAVGTRRTGGAFPQAARPCKVLVQSLPSRFGRRPRTYVLVFMEERLWQ